jgi:DNA-binding MarR family transcriptional regulator
MESERQAISRQLRQQVQLFIRSFGVLAEDRTPCGVPLSPREAQALLFVLEGGRKDVPPLQNELAAALGIDKSCATRLIQSLRDEGRLRQAVSREDRRARHLHLTPEGQRLALDLEAASQRHFTHLLEAIPAAQRRKIVEAFQHLNQALGGLAAGTKNPEKP